MTDDYFGKTHIFSIARIFVVVERTPSIRPFLTIIIPNTFFLRLGYGLVFFLNVPIYKLQFNDGKILISFYIVCKLCDLISLSNMSLDPHISIDI